MKRYILLLTLIISYTILAKDLDTSSVKTEPGYRRDLLYPEILTDTNQKYRNELTNFTFDHFDSTTYFDQLKSLRPLSYKKTIPSSFPRKWIALYQRKGKFFLYRPCDWGYHFRFEITDSTTINYTMEGPEPSRLEKIYFPSTTDAIIEGTNYWEGRRVEIKQLDTTKGISVISFGPTKFRKGVSCVLMVDARKAHLFPVIVNDCPTSKALEMDFDKIDFELLLKQRAPGK